MYTFIMEVVSTNKGICYTTALTTLCHSMNSSSYPILFYLQGWNLFLLWLNYTPSSVVYIRLITQKQYLHSLHGNILVLSIPPLQSGKIRCFDYRSHHVMNVSLIWVWLPQYLIGSDQEFVTALTAWFSDQTWASLISDRILLQSAMWRFLTVMLNCLLSVVYAKYI